MIADEAGEHGAAVGADARHAQLDRELGPSDLSPVISS
jgi:hypothetical protein